VLPIARVVIDDYLSGAFDQVFLVYPYFVNTMTQQPEARQLLPVEPPAQAATHAVDYIYEPGRETVLAELLPRYIEMQIFEAVLEGIASEQSARMVAMRNATEAADEMIQELTLTYNKARQEQITKELLDIVGGVEGLKV
jgi:F-type H+-transporting ATPase subunit gamma